MNFIPLLVITGVAVIAWGLCLSRVFCPFRSANTNDKSPAKPNLAKDRPRATAKRGSLASHGSDLLLNQS